MYIVLGVVPLARIAGNPLTRAEKIPDPKGGESTIWHEKETN